MNKNIVVALGATVLSFCTLYTPQPILPLLSAEFGVTATAAGLLVTFTLIPLALAPVVYGYFLQAIPARTMASAATLGLAVNQFALAFAAEFWHLLALRFMQGLLLPAILTSLATYCATIAAPGAVRRVMGWYIGATICGGFAGRLLGGLLTHYLNWHWMFAVIGLMMTAAWLGLRCLRADAEINFQRLSARAIKRVFAAPLYRRSYAVVFAVFLAFSGVLNLLPFRLLEIDSTLGARYAAWLYAGYLIGAPAAVWSARLARACKTVNRALLAGLAATAGGLVACLIFDARVLFAMMFLLAGGMFFTHAVLIGVTNALATEHKGVVNGLYVSIYYSAGALGSWLPGYVYLEFGWSALIIILLCMLGLGAVFAARLKINAGINTEINTEINAGNN